jgi:hypothetical protein
MSQKPTAQTVLNISIITPDAVVIAEREGQAMFRVQRTVGIHMLLIGNPE